MEVVFGYRYENETEIHYQVFTTKETDMCKVFEEYYQARRISEFNNDIVICSVNPLGTTGYWFRTHCESDVPGLDCLEVFDTASDMYYRVARFYLCYDQECVQMRNINRNGIKLHYVGWRPGMRFELRDESGNTYFNQCFPEWES